MINKAMILAAGFGRRLRPLTLQRPKPLLRVGDETLLSITLELLQKFGIKEVVINVHYLGEQIIDYINKKKFNLKITIVKEKKKILDTGGGVLNVLEYFSNNPFLIINSDTVWNLFYLKELKLMEKKFFKNKNSKCLLLVVNKKKSLDKSLKGDFNLENDLINRNYKNNLNYIYTGLQIIKPEAFTGVKEIDFSINKIWDKLIATNELNGIESNVDFLHISTFKFYKSLSEKLNWEKTKR
ncbi:nucleotidyltransferase family protein [Pelagibacteraceae bacterium]|nr:nucleotidyltransferase family protein [Pelagibacteraceae bacterium]